ncbi:ankyrin [Mytilinidion resinicola]|uniref:Ankyrin n=1 Tax=Mytilinidion resinicola TaxID=574789 RepID=A0A6A6YWU5_9PEZI|nr:ankyrin [Mytilinidion resinicola]KAF2812455.1 ankyrin [Mytilinidion resinicola]
MFSFLLENGAKPSLTEDTGLTPLHLLIFFEPVVIHDVAAQLMARGANIYAQTRRDHVWILPWHGISLKGTPLHFAVSCRNMVAIKTLLRFGADPNQRAGFLSSLDLAASFNFPEICALLIEHGATTNTHWFAGRSPLHWIGDPVFCSPLGKLIIHGPKYREAVALCVDILLSHDAVIDEPDNGHLLGENLSYS